ncbi:HEPN domain-containing protein [Pedobacter cryophilus]|uniref:HEPN domain-containing protein n=1 Tax=Pedobacter cryophilus TaxID=2571271 RepID=A0A4U1C038_9SPHI|nr:HEPN domain-containing protein [Pedobacter cryophilus]TKB98541.1 HEPN domain-containing protein [Pedobacter cryophilus]
MQSFRTELENPLVEKDIIALEQKIRAFREGKIDDERFRSLRLARGVYGQRQPGVQMVRIKLPFGKVTFKQFLKIADISDEYASSNLHLTTRQDIQIHYVSLDRTPELWSKLEQDDITLREACGNTVRNVTASPTAGIDPSEPFDVSPYAHAFFEYFLRNPICQEMGRKIKFAFSSSEADTAFSFIHDLGFIPKLKLENGEDVRGFKVVLGGGLGAQPSLAHIVHEFLHEDLIIPYAEAVLRVFDRHGERNNRNKARLKFLVNKIGIDELVKLVEEEKIANKVKTFKINRDSIIQPQAAAPQNFAEVAIKDQLAYQLWLDTNVFEQKQKGFYGVYVKVQTGDIKTDLARKFIAAISGLVADEIRITINQGLLLKFATKEALPSLFLALEELGLSAPGFDSVADVTTCPGTDTCNLGISNSMELSRVLESVIYDEYPSFIEDKEIKIKISGCMNSCGQHGLAQIGFHGSSMKANGKVMPAVQVLLGGGIVGDGVGRAADKVVKVPSKRAPQVLRAVLNDYQAKADTYQSFHQYYDDLGKDYFYQLLKPIADQTTLTDEDFVDWGHQETFQTAIGVGECAGVVIDLVATLIFEAEEKFEWAKASFENKAFADAIYQAYNAMVSGAKALLLDKGVNQSTQTGVMKAFDEHYAAALAIESFTDLVLQINKNEPSAVFAEAYLASASDFLTKIKNFRVQPELAI